MVVNAAELEYAVAESAATAEGLRVRNAGSARRRSCGGPARL
jgi:hypothetical protein